MAFGMKNILQGGLAANYSEQSPEELAKEYGMYPVSYTHLDVYKRQVCIVIMAD